MRGDTILFILKALQEGVSTAWEISDLLDYYSIRSTNARFWGAPVRRPVKHKQILKDKIAFLESRRKVAKFISKLKSEGFISKNQEGSLCITEAGDFKLNSLLALKNIRPHYEVSPSEEVKIITFDIPEKKKVCRNWLRLALKDMNFNFLQKSVWVGTAALPEEFLDDLRKQEIFDFVEIFAVTKKGTLRQIRG